MESGKLGTYLREGREGAGLTTELIAQQTRIPLASIKALEEERFDELPALVFVRGFVRAYCRTAGSDPRPALEQLNERTEPQQPRTRLMFAGAERPILLTAAPTGSSGFRLSRLIIVLVAVAILVAAYVLAGAQGGEKGRSTAATDGAPATMERMAPSSARPDTGAVPPD